jgi:VanZ family protein
MAFIYYLSSLPDLKSSLPTAADFVFRKIAHFAEYAVLYLLLWKLLEGTGYRRITALVIAMLYAMTDEFHQAFVNGRVASVADVGIDAAGSIFMLWITQKLPQKRQF